MSDFQGSFGGGGRRPPHGKRVPRKRTRVKVRVKKKDPLLVDGKRPRPMYVDYKDVELLTKLVNRHGRIVSRRKSGCSAASQHAVSKAVKRARFMALMPYVGE
jgi:small subunit ribosomal protein S18